MVWWNWRGRPGRGLLAVLVAVLACASTVVAGWRSLPDGGRYAAYMTWRYAGPRGELAADSAVRDAALRSWDARTGMAPDEKALLAHALGPARIVWAGDAAGVRGVVVAQSAYVTPREMPGLDEGVEPRHDVWGFLRIGPEGAATVAAVTAYDLASLPYLRALGGWLDPARGIGVVLDLGTPSVVSETVELTSTGGYGRVSRPLTFRPDGIAVVDVADGIGPLGVVVGPARRPLTDSYGLAGDAKTGNDPAVLAWTRARSDRRAIVPIAGTSSPPWSVDRVFGTFDEATIGRLSTVPNMSYSTAGWLLGGWLADGTGVTIGAITVGGTDRLTSLVGDVFTDHGILDPAAPLPVAIRLPDGRGWVVAAPGATLRYRPAGKAWRPAGFEAALVPAGPAEIGIHRPGRPASTVRLG